MTNKVAVNEKKRRIYCEDRVIVLNNVKSFDPSGTWIRLESDEGYTIINPNKIVYHQIEGDVAQ